MDSAQALLALFLHAQTPGRSPHAKIVLEQCDETCQTKRACSAEVLYCREPVWSPRYQRFVRYETFAEGVRRYALLASVVVDIAQHRTKRGRWSGTERQLELLVATVIAHESGFRRDVHEGSTRGDCDYRTIGGRRQVIPGSCRAHCLGQVTVKRGERTARGYSGDDLVGLDRASTSRCIDTVVDHLSRAHDLCVAQNGRPGAYPACTMGTYGGLENWSTDPRIVTRLATYNALSTRLAARKPLAPEVLAALGAREGK